MTLRYYTAPLAFQPHIQSFAFLEESQADFNQRIILPDAYPGLSINFGAPMVWEVENSAPIELPRAFFVWMQTKPQKIRATGWCRTIHLNLSAWATRCLIGEQVDLSVNPIIPLGGKWHDMTQLLEATLRQHGDAEALATLGQFVNDLCRRSDVDVTLIRNALDMLYRTRGHHHIHELAANCYISASQLERRTKYFTGLTPKALARLIRFDAACTGLASDAPFPMTDLAHQLGYSDQAHFIHEFRAFADCTPGEAKPYVCQLAADAEFLQLS